MTNLNSTDLFDCWYPFDMSIFYHPSPQQTIARIYQCLFGLLREPEQGWANLKWGLLFYMLPDKAYDTSMVLRSGLNESKLSGIW